MYLQEKKISELTPEERKALYKPIGTSAAPYPGARAVRDSEKKIINMEFGVVASDANPIQIYSDQSKEFVYGQMWRRMATPSLLFAQQTILEQRQLDSKSRLVILLGDPGNGKTEVPKTVALACDPRGAMQIDCGGRYMSDLLWEQVIDYGEDFRTALTQRIRSGKLSETSIEVFDEKFPDALKRDKENNNVIDIDWEKAKSPVIIIDGKTKEPEFGTRGELLHKGLEYIRDIAESEGIPPQTTNMVGIKKNPGIVKRAFDGGYELILDEYTKSIIGSDDSLQTVLSFVNGQIDEVTVENSTKTNGKDDNASYTLRREDMRVGFHVTATGNESSDGYSTHALSGSASSRFTTLTSGKPTLDDWKHRISQIQTGLPLSTISRILPGPSQNDSEGFGDTLVQLRPLGLPEREQAKIPPEELTRLKMWEKTIKAVEIETDYYMFFKQLVNPVSDLNRRKLNEDDPANAADIAIVADKREGIKQETNAAFCDQCAIDPRKAIQDHAGASTIKPAVMGRDEASGVSLNLAAISHQNLKPPVNAPEDISAGYGTRMVDVMMTRVATTLADKPTLNTAMYEKMEKIGVIPSDDYTGETLADLLNQPLIPNLGSTRNVSSFQKVLAAHLRNAGTGLKTDDEIVPMDEAAAAFDELKRLSADSAGTSPRKGRVILLGPDLKRVFNQASAVDIICDENQTAPVPGELVRASDFLKSLEIPDLADLNMKAIWRDTVSVEKLIEPSAVATPVVQMAENKHSSGIGITTVMMQGANGNAVPLRFMHDDERRKDLIVIPDKVDSTTKSALDRSGYTVVTCGDPDAETRAGEFIRETLEQPSRKSSLTDIEPRLIAAFMMRAGNEAQLQSLKKLMTTRDMPAEAPVYLINKPL